MIHADSCFRISVYRGPAVLLHSFCSNRFYEAHSRVYEGESHYYKSE